MYGSRRDESALVTRVCADYGRITQIKKRRERPQAAGAIGVDLLLNRPSSWFRDRFRRSCRGTFPHVEFELPATAVLRDAPEFEHSGFGDIALECDGNDLFG
jgi:hypothetical protein